MRIIEVRDKWDNGMMVCGCYHEDDERIKEITELAEEKGFYVINRRMDIHNRAMDFLRQF